MRINLDDEWFSAAVADDLLWHVKHAESPKLRKALLKVAVYYMTFEQAAQYLGTKEAVEEMWHEH